MIRVDSWQVCQCCVSNKVLEQAIEVRSDVKKLTAAVSGTRVEHQHDSKRLREAQDRLQGIYADLATAIKSLAAISEESHESLVRSLQAVEELKEYRDTEAQKTRKARKT